jgi:hypothetical protein
MPAPIRITRITPEQMSAIKAAANTLVLADRAPFLEAVAEGLRGREIGNGIVGRAIREAQAKFWRPPQLERTTGTSRLD